MNYIVLDLEWNQPLSYNSPAYKSVGGKLLFEMLQIGAIKLDENRRIVDTFNQIIQPTHYLKLHPRIRRITQISQDDLAGAPNFPEALSAFAAWCGTDEYVLLTWGCDDISVLYQNMTFFKCKTQLGAFYDMQPVFGEITGNTKDRKSLKSAMDYYQLDPDEEKPFHNAENDAYYTAQVFAHFPEPAAVFKFPQTPKRLVHIEHRRNEKNADIAVENIAGALKSPAACRPSCPTCGKKLTLTNGFVRQRDGRYIALADCPEHGLIFIKLQFVQDEKGSTQMSRTVALSDEQSSAYVSTKHLQWEQKLKAQQESEP